MKKKIENILLVAVLLASLVLAVVLSEVYWFSTWIFFASAFASVLGLIKLNSDWLDEYD